MIQTKQDVLQLEAEINAIKNKSKELTEANFNKSIQENWDRLKRIVAEENLKMMPVDTISTLEKGMPINRLVNLGFETIYDIKDQTVEDLMMIEGIGEIGAHAIHGAVSKIKSSVVQEARPTINPDWLSAEEIALLNSIYMKKERLEATESLQKDLTAFIELIEAPLQRAKNHKGFVGRLFQAKAEKEEIRHAMGC